MQATDKPLLSLSLDLDDKWSYLKTRGLPAWQQHPSYLPELVEEALPLLDRFGFKITFFIVGKDAAMERNHAALRQLADAGHEIANHSFSHEPWFHLYEPERVRAEVVDAARSIEDATGCRPIGFRGPGYSFTPETARVLAAEGYRYDASTFPTFLGPLARAYYFRRKLSADERRERGLLFGSWREGLRPLRPHLHDAGEGRLVEMPITTMPGLRLPFHASYLLYLRQHGRAIATCYRNLCFLACRLTRLSPSYLLHPLDILGSDRVSDLDFFPGMQLKTSDKLDMLADLFAYIAEHFSVVDVQTHAAGVAAAAEQAEAVGAAAEG